MEETFITVLGLTGLLAMTSLLLPVARRLDFPHTVLLALAGGALGAVAFGLENTEGLGLVGDFVEALDSFSITAEAVFFIFLPTLVFESALAIDVRRLMDDLAPILLLAVIGLLISTFMVGGALYAFADVGFIVCLLLGAIVSATDPVAVVAIFKDLGAPKRLAILVEGESLFNDATAIVMYTILIGMLAGGRDADLVAGTVDFVRVFAGGVVVGFVFARAVCWVLARLHGVPLVEITLTVCLAYLSFILAEHYLHVSGVMAVVTAALVVGSTGRTAISPETWHGLVETWEQLGFWANSLIFVLVGLAVPRILADFGTEELGLLAVLTIAAFAARAVILYGLLPLFGRAGLSAHVSRAYQTVMFWGGLRGAVSLALALAVLENPLLDPAIKHLVVVLVTGFVLFTLLVNATTMSPLLAALGLDALSPADRDIRNRALALSLSAVRDSLREVAAGYRMPPPLTDEQIARYDQRLAEIEDEAARVTGLTEADRQRSGLMTLAGRERRLYLKHFNHGYIAPVIARRLLGQADTIVDGVKTGGVEGYRAAVARTFAFEPAFRAALVAQRRFGHSAPLARLLADRYERLLVTQMVLRELIGHNQRKIVPLFGAETGAVLDDVLNQRLAATDRQVEALRLTYPEYAETLQRRLLERVALRLEEAEHATMLEQSIISQEVYKDLERGLDSRRAALDERPRLDLGLEPSTLIAKVPFFADLDPARLAAIAKLLQSRLVVPGERLVRKGEPGDAMYFISSGAVEVALDPTPVMLGSGDFFGEIALLKDQPRNADVTALSYCQVLVLPVAAFRRFLEAEPSLREHITRVAEQRLASA